MVVFDAVDPAAGVHREGNPVQTLVADGAAEAAGVVGLPQGLQDLRRNTAHCQNPPIHRETHLNSTHPPVETSHFIEAMEREESVLLRSSSAV